MTARRKKRWTMMITVKTISRLPVHFNCSHHLAEINSKKPFSFILPIIDIYFTIGTIELVLLSNSGPWPACQRRPRSRQKNNLGQFEPRRNTNRLFVRLSTSIGGGEEKIFGRNFDLFWWCIQSRAVPIEPSLSQKPKLKLFAWA